MGKVADQIKKLQIKEELTLPELFKKYPHLAELQHLELMEEDLAKRQQKQWEAKKKQMKLLLD
jgi:hypothetical protein|tara:strand:+ start:521 stop:709 length:189 start_codon:yes stop_codon:yes gene_type:complete